MRSLVVAALALAAVPAYATIDVVATTSSMAMLVRTVGGDAVRITTLAPPDRDAHHLLAKPSMMAALRRADLLVTVGAELEIGWLPAALEGAGNGRILPGNAGYFEGAAQIDLLEVQPGASRAQGDVHPAGNPHYYMDPLRMARIATALAERLAMLDAGRAARFRENAAAFAAQAASRVETWRSRFAGAPGVLLYHKDANYLAALLGVTVHGYIEPLPGIPPTAPHLRALVDALKGKQGVIVINSFHPRSGPDFLQKQLGWPVRQLQHEVDLGADGTAYLDHVETWVRAMADARS